MELGWRIGQSEGLEEWVARGVIRISGFFPNGFGASRAWICAPHGVVSTKGWGPGSDPFSVEPAEVISETSLLRTLELVKECLAGCEHPPKFILARAGKWRTMAALRRLFNEGAIGLIPSAAPEVALTLKRLVPKLRC